MVDLGLLLINYHYSFVPIVGPVLVLQEEPTETPKLVIVVIRTGAGTGNAHIVRATRVLLFLPSRTGMGWSGSGEYMALRIIDWPNNSMECQAKNGLSLEICRHVINHYYYSME